MKYFGWTDSVYAAFSKTFPGDYGDDALCLLHKCIKDEFYQAVRSKDEQNLEKLFFCLGDFYKHFCWKINWQKDSLYSMKRSCINTLSYLIQVGIILSQGKLSTKWIDSILIAMKVFPGSLELLCDSLILVYNVKEQFRPSFGVILKHFLFTNRVNVSGTVHYFKIMMLLRRFKFMTNRLERAKVVTLALSIQVPSDSQSWLLSHGIENLTNVNRKLFTKMFLSKKLPPEFFKELRKALKVEVQPNKDLCLSNVKDSFVIDTGMANQEESPVKIIAEVPFVKDDSQMLVDPSSDNSLFVRNKRKKIKLANSSHSKKSEDLIAVSAHKHLPDDELTVGENKHRNIIAQKLEKESIILPPLCPKSIEKDNKVLDKCQKETSGDFSSESKIDIYLSNCVEDTFVIDTKGANQDVSSAKVVAKAPFVKDDAETVVDSPSYDYSVSSFIGKKRIKLTEYIKTEDCNKSKIVSKHLLESGKEKVRRKNKRLNITSQKLRLESPPICHEVKDNRVSFEQVNKTIFTLDELHVTTDSLITSVEEKHAAKKLLKRSSNQKVPNKRVKDKSNCRNVDKFRIKENKRINEKNQFLQQIQLQPSLIQAEDSISALQSADDSKLQPMIEKKNASLCKLDAVRDKGNSMSCESKDLITSCPLKTEKYNAEHFEGPKKSECNNSSVNSEGNVSEKGENYSLDLKIPDTCFAPEHEISSSEKYLPSPKDVALKLSDESLANYDSNHDLNLIEAVTLNNLTHNAEFSLNNILEEASKYSNVNRNFNKELNTKNLSSLANETELHKNNDNFSDAVNSLSKCFQADAIERNKIESPNCLVTTINDVDSTGKKVLSLKELTSASNLFVNSKQTQNEKNKMNVSQKGNKVESPFGLGNYIENVLYKLVDEVVDRINNDIESSCRTSTENLTPNESSVNININKSETFTAVDNNCLTFFDVSNKTLVDCKEYNQVNVKSNLLDYRDSSLRLEFNLNDVSTSKFPEMDYENESLSDGHSSSDEIDILDFNSPLNSTENFLDDAVQSHDLEIENQTFPPHAKVVDSSPSQIIDCTQSKCESKTLTPGKAVDFVAKLPKLTVENEKLCNHRNLTDYNELFTNCSEKEELTQESGVRKLQPSKTEDVSRAINNQECLLKYPNVNHSLTNIESEKNYTCNSDNKIAASQTNEILEIEVDGIKITEYRIFDSAQVFKESPQRMVDLENGCDTNGKFEENEDNGESTIQIVENDDVIGKNKVEHSKSVNQSNHQDDIHQAHIVAGKNGETYSLQELVSHPSRDSQMVSVDSLLDSKSSNGDVEKECSVFDTSVQGKNFPVLPEERFGLPLTASNSSVKERMTLRHRKATASNNSSSPLKVKTRRKKCDLSDPALTSNLSRLTLNSPSRSKLALEAKQQCTKSLRNTRVASDCQPESNKGYNLRSRKPLILPAKLKYPK